MFIKISTELVDGGQCSLAEFKEWGGWTKATGARRNQPVYFIYCGGYSAADRLYLDASTGEVFQ